MIEYFKQLYETWEINDFENFYASLSPKFNRDMIFKAGEGAGRSGSFFFFSHDSKFVVKTVSQTELKLILRMMPNYTKHLMENKSSLLCKILGIFTVEAESFSRVHIMLMENTIRLKDRENLKYVFDLKGSKVDRTVSGKTAKDTTLKDMNFLLTKKNFRKLTTLDVPTKMRLIQAMRSDVGFLRSLNLMDYSLLIAIEKTSKSKKKLHIDE
jgi:hypothetical protein